MKGRALFFKVNLDNLLSVVPGTTGVGKKDGLEKTEKGNRNEVPDKEIRVEEREGQSEEKNDDEDVDHPFLRVLCANLNNFFTVLYRCLRFV